MAHLEGTFNPQNDALTENLDHISDLISVCSALLLYLFISELLSKICAVTCQLTEVAPVVSNHILEVASATVATPLPPPWADYIKCWNLLWGKMSLTTRY